VTPRSAQRNAAPSSATYPDSQVLSDDEAHG
jgi:hypothetical protein